MNSCVHVVGLSLNNQGPSEHAIKQNNTEMINGMPAYICTHLSHR